MNLHEQAAAFREAGRRAGDYLAMMQRPHGGVTGDDFAMDVFHKLPYAFAVTGRLVEGYRLLSWIKRERGWTGDGGVNLYLEPVRMQIYKHAWLVLGAQRLGWADLSGRAFEFLLGAQLPCGGFTCEDPGEGQARALTTGWCGVAALAMNRLDVAQRAGEAMIRLFEQQPERDKFHFFMTPDGQVKVRPPGPDADDGLYARDTRIDVAEPGQFYWEVGMGMILLTRLYEATGEPRWIDGALRYLAFNLRCQPDGFSHPAAGKSGMGAALVYAASGDERALEAAVRQSSYLVRTQEPSGAWALPPAPDGFVTRLDQAGEFCVWLSEVGAILEAARFRVGEARTGGKANEPPQECGHD